MCYQSISSHLSRSREEIQYVHLQGRSQTRKIGEYNEKSVGGLHWPHSSRPRVLTLAFINQNTSITQSNMLLFHCSPPHSDPTHSPSALSHTLHTPPFIEGRQRSHNTGVNVQHISRSNYWPIITVSGLHIGPILVLKYDPYCCPRDPTPDC